MANTLKHIKQNNIARLKNMRYSFGQKIVKITTDNKNKITIDDSKISLLPAEVAQYSLSTYATEKVTIEAKKNAKYPSWLVPSKISLLKYNEMPINNGTREIIGDPILIVFIS